jgi:hypothetical protein
MTQMVARFRCGAIKTRRRPTAAISGDMPSPSESRRTFENTVPARPSLARLIAYGAANNAGKDRVKLRLGSRATGTGGSNVARSIQNIKLFRPSAARSIDFGQFAPMFRFDAARYRNAIS